MPDPKYSHVLLIVDRSGSMLSCVDDTIGGVNAFVEQQRTGPGRCSLSLVLFDHHYERPVSFLGLESFQPVTRLTYQPRGSTALLDAVGRAMTEESEHLSAMPEANRPGLVAVVIVTDGFENASKEWTKDRVQSLIEQQTKEYGWSVQFLGANLDVAEQGASVGVPVSSVGAYGSTTAGLAASSYSVTRGRRMSDRGGSRAEIESATAYSAEDRDLMSLTADELRAKAAGPPDPGSSQIKGQSDASGS